MKKQIVVVFCLMAMVWQCRR